MRRAGGGGGGTFERKLDVEASEFDIWVDYGAGTYVGVVSTWLQVS